MIVYICPCHRGDKKHLISGCIYWAEALRSFYCGLSSTEPPRSWNRLTVWAGPECSGRGDKRNNTPLTFSALVTIFIMMLFVWMQLLSVGSVRASVQPEALLIGQREVCRWKGKKFLTVMLTRAAEMKLKQQSWKSEIQRTCGS